MIFGSGIREMPLLLFQKGKIEKILFKFPAFWTIPGFSAIIDLIGKRIESAGRSRLWQENTKKGPAELQLYSD